MYNLILDPKQIMSDPDAYLEASVSALVDCFGYDRTEMMNLINEKKDKYYIRYAKQLTYDQKENFEKYKESGLKMNIRESIPTILWAAM